LLPVIIALFNVNEIQCPKCGNFFEINETINNTLVKKIRNKEFEKEIKYRMDIEEKNRMDSIKLAEEKLKNSFKESLSNQSRKISELESKLDKADLKESLAVNNLKITAEKERIELNNKLEILNEKGRNLFKNMQIEKQLAINEAVSKYQKELEILKSNIQQTDLKRKLEEKSIIEKYEYKIRDRETEIERLRDMKLKLSTKMLGETLEKHCEFEFNRIRSTGFPNAYFEKDNNQTSGSKGDYIFRERDEYGTEIVSIMFEMKNQSDETATKKKNEDFFKELDKDRNQKNCEYAVLVSLLESDNELYNSGIVDVSYKYKKMYVIRPQLFIPIISILRNASMKSLEYKKELSLIKMQNIDITNFESDLEIFRNSFGKNYDLASRRFETAIEEIDKSINHLQKTKDALIGADRNLRIANNKLQEVSIKRLTKNNPTMSDKFKSLNNK
tara:strand:- start:2686 stop:4020 length:1335 start_codon:yes stop_codon:yes gene_type:complete